MEIEFHPPPPPPQVNNTRRVAAGELEMCLTGVTHFLLAQASLEGDCQARFGAVVHQRSPLTVATPAGSGIGSLAELGGRRMPRPPEDATGWLLKECLAALRERGLDPPVLVAMAQSEVPRALADGEVDAVATYADVVPNHEAKSGVPLASLALGLDVYGTGLVVNDEVPTDAVGRMRDAIATAFDRQRQDPASGVEAFCAHEPAVDPRRAHEGWTILEPHAFVDPPAGSMRPDRWQATVDWLCGVHDLQVPPPERVYRTELAAAPATPSP